ncbi:hypothetical protein WJX75_007409 [Coccomyxa subellipsoidea]|uniref:J domain-containing protein n=1 Tax=Coccomyxa subellipsoidea TaxID=248742 RepID=A0ABR2Z0G9_9CHLO
MTEVESRCDQNKRTHSCCKAQQSEKKRKEGKGSGQKGSGDADLDTSAPMQASDAIQRILAAKKEKDWFRLLELEPPEIDALGRTVWGVPSADVSKAYRRLSVLVHPDKNPGADARAAFECLNEAHRLLRNRGQLEEVLKEHADTARRRKEAAEAAATPEERVILYAAKKDAAKELQKQEGESFQAEIVRQMREKQMAAKRKREMRSSYRRQEDEEEDEFGEPLEEERAERAAGAVKKPAAKKRGGKPSIIF